MTTDVTGFIGRSAVPAATSAGRLFMTFLETGAMTRQYREAEVVLLPGSGPFF